MKFVAVFFFALLIGALGYDWDAAELECVEELKLNKAEIEVLDDPWDKPTPIDNKVLNDYLECSWKKEGAMDDHGEIIWEKIDDIIVDEVKEDIEKNKSDSAERIKALIAGGVLKSAVDKCREEKIHGTSHGQTAAKVQNCVGEKLREVAGALGD